MGRQDDRFQGQGDAYDDESVPTSGFDEDEAMREQERQRRQRPEDTQRTGPSGDLDESGYEEELPEDEDRWEG